MAIPEASPEEEQQLHAFQHMRELMTALQVFAPNLDTLSMGMSADLEPAIAQGSNLIRIGTDIFGPRNR